MAIDGSGTRRKAKAIVTMNNPPPASPPAPHCCFSATFGCSGCNPCPACLEVVRACVLPSALAASGLNEVATAYFDLLVALEQRGVTDPRAQLGVEIVRMRSLQEMFANAFQGFAAGWPALHQRMLQGDLAGRFAVTTEPQPTPSAVLIAPLAPEPASPPPQPPAATSVTAQAELPWTMPQVDASAPAVSRTAETSAPPQIAAAPEPARAPPPRPFGVDELARALAVPAPPVSERQVANGSTNGAPVG